MINKDWWKIEPSFRSRGIGPCGFASDATGRSRERKRTFLVLWLSRFFWVIQTRKRGDDRFLCEGRVEISNLSKGNGITLSSHGEYRVRVRWNAAWIYGGCGGCWWAHRGAASDYGVEIPIVGHWNGYSRETKASNLWGEKRKQRRQKRALTFEG